MAENILTARQEKAIPVILAARTIEDGIKRARVSKTTFYKWMKDEAFRAEYERRRKTLVRQAYDMLRLSLADAADVLAGLLKSQDERLRRMAAVNVLELYGKHIELDDIGERLSRLERLFENKA